MIAQATIDDLYFQIAELNRRLAMMIVPGTIKSYDPKADTAQVNYALDKDGKDVTTHDVPNGGHAGTAKSWRPLKPGQQVTLFSPSGDLANAFLMPGGFHDQNKAPSQSADEDILGVRGEGDQAVRHRLTDDEASLDCVKHQTLARAGKDIAELDNKKHKSAVRAAEDGKVKLEVTAVEKLKIKIGDQWFYIRPEALLPTSE